MIDSFTAPTPEEVGASYDLFTDLYGLTVGDVGLHVGMWSEPGEREPASSLGDLANRAQERQTEYHIETLGLKADEHVPELRVQRRADGTALHRPARRDR